MIGDVAIVTGASRGIGLSIAHRLAADGARLCIMGRDPGALEAARTELAAVTEVVAMAGDVASEADVARVVEAAASLGSIGAVVNNAASRGPTTPLHEIAVDEFDRVIDVNLRGAFLLVRAAVPAMIERHRGSIVNIGSVAGFEAYPLRAAYCASKWALVGLTRTMAVEYGPSGIRANLVAPGPTAGEGADGVIATRAAALEVPFEELKAQYEGEIPLRRFVTTDETAVAVAFLVSDAASGITGQSICVSGGIEV